MLLKGTRCKTGKFAFYERATVVGEVEYSFYRNEVRWPREPIRGNSQHCTCSSDEKWQVSVSGDLGWRRDNGFVGTASRAPTMNVRAIVE
jgi:hypothetical protein